jgi:hypothetical protein
MEDFGIAHTPENSVLAFLASRSRQPSRQLSAPAIEVFKGIRDTVDQFLLAALEARTKAEYRQVFARVFPQYAGITLTLAGFSQAVIPQEVVNRMARESICEMEAEFRDKALPAFGAAVKQQAMFTVWTLRKVSDLLIQIADVKPSSPKADSEFSRNFNINAISAKFSLDCLLMALHSNRPIYPEVVEELTDGLRSMVNAYAWARKGLDLRIPDETPAVEGLTMDEEDRNLLEAAWQNASELEA